MSQMGQKRWPKSEKSSKDLCPSLLLRVTLQLKIFLFVELREEKGKLSHLFKGMVVFIELSGAATRCPCFLMTAPEWGICRDAATRARTWPFLYFL